MRIEARFCGPPGLANGGYACGVFSEAAGRPHGATVTLRKPVPLGESLTGAEAEGGFVVSDGSCELIAEVQKAEPLSLDPPRTVTPEEAAAAVPGSPFLSDRHTYPGCFVCGPEHDHGLGIHVGSLDDDGELAAAPFEPPADLVEESGMVPDRIVWAALDCPSYVPAMWGKTVLLGRLTAQIDAEVPAGEPLISMGWKLGREGRKLHSAAALLDGDGRILARSRALWIALASD